MPTKSKSFQGSWRIAHMDEWTEEYLDLVETARIRNDKRGQGEFIFGAVKGWLDCRFTERDGLPFVEFSWEGLSEGDSVCGRGWASLQSDGSLNGHLSSTKSFFWLVLGKRNNIQEFHVRVPAKCSS